MRMMKLSALCIAAASLFLPLGARATIVDLINGNGPGTINGAMFEWTDFSSSGTGNTDPFLRVQADGTEQGYNTSNPSPPFERSQDGAKSAPKCSSSSFGVIKTTSKRMAR